MNGEGSGYSHYGGGGFLSSGGNGVHRGFPFAAGPTDRTIFFANDPVTGGFGDGAGLSESGGGGCSGGGGRLSYHPTNRDGVVLGNGTNQVLVGNAHNGNGLVVITPRRQQ